MSTRPVLTLRGAHAPSPTPAPKPTPPPPDVPIERFFFIWSPTTHRPRIRHATLAAAEAEAARLRELAPEREYLIYEAVLVAEAAPTNTDVEGGHPP